MGNILFHLQFPTVPDPASMTLESWFESLDGWEQFKSGSANIVLDADKVTMTTGTTISSVATIIQRFLYPPKDLTWGKNRTFRLKMRIDHANDANSNNRIYTGSPSTNNRGFGFKFTNTKIQGYSQNGAAEQTVDLITGLTPPWTATHLYEAIFLAGSKIDFYIDGVLVGTLTAGLPTGTTNAEQLIGITIINGTAVGHTLSLSAIRATQET